MPLQKVEVGGLEQEKPQLPTPPPERAAAETVDEGEKTVESSSVSNLKKTMDELDSKKTDKSVSAIAKEEDKSEKEAESSSSEEKPADKSKTSEEVTVSKPDSSDSTEKTEEKSEKKDDDKSKDDADKKDETADTKKEDEEKKKKKLVPKGMKAEIKNLFAKGDNQCKCCTTWVEENPDDSKSVEESDECRQHAIVVRKKKKHEGNRKPLKVDSIVVHSPLLKKVLIKVFEGYPDLVIDLQELIFEAPFAPFFHRWDKFEQAKDSEADEQTKSHIELLYEALSIELKPTITKHRDLLRHNAIDFDILWTLFPPGALMYSIDHGHDRLYKTGDCEYFTDISGSLKFMVRCSMIDWNGEKFGMVNMNESIAKFKGSKQITSLSSYPLKFHPNAEEMKAKIVERGRKFKSLAGVHCKDYKGTAIEYCKFAVQTVTNKRHIEGRIMLDEEMFAKFNPDEAQDVRDIEDEDESKPDIERIEKEAEDAKASAKKAESENDEKSEVSNEKAEKDAGEKPAVPAKTEGEQTEDATVDKVSEKTDLETKSDTNPSDEVAEKVTTTEPSQPAKKDTEEKSSDVKESESTDTSTTGIPTPASSTGSADDSNDSPTATTEDEAQELSEFQLAICNSWLRGYSLTYQKWASFAVDNIVDVSWNDDAFSELTLPPDYRELILATIKSQIRQNQIKQAQEAAEKANKKFPTLAGSEKGADSGIEFDDFIRGKGRGYIMLFAGNPGVGKTATAESIAELLHVPLCMISVGNLGTNAESVESSLQDILEIAAKWNAVLLLDEADIFLEQRTKHDLHRNAVVSVFLRLLEYYQGVLCLTTNRSEEIDVAFHSRIHISLPFPDLSEGSREGIWKQFAKMTDKKAEAEWQQRKARATRKDENKAAPSGEVSDSKTNESKIKNMPESSESALPEPEDGPILVNLSNADFRKLGQHPLNGRQIKNAFKTAVLLASYKKERVGMKHVKTALKTIDGLRKEGMSMYT